MDVYRINKEPYHTDPLSVVGSYRHGGRWNSKGIGILYTSRSPELALLETLVHLPPIALPELPQLWLTTIRLPDTDNQAIFWLEPAKLPSYWHSDIHSETQVILKEWLNNPFCLAIAIPSVIVEEAYNLLLHPQHESFTRIEVVNRRAIPFDSRLRQ